MEKASFCCSDYNINHSVGDVTMNSITNIWNGEEMHRIRNKLKSGKVDDLDICKNCYTIR